MTLLHIAKLLMNQPADENRAHGVNPVSLQYVNVVGQHILDIHFLFLITIR
jgi:hypothetical protein